MPDELTVTLIIVLLMFAYMGWLHKTSDPDEYHVQKRQVPAFRTAASIFTIVGAPHFAFITALAYISGWWVVLFYFGSFTGFVVLSFFAKKIRTYIPIDAQSLPDIACVEVGILSSRVISAFCLLFLCGVTITQVVVGATIITSIADTDYSIAVILMLGAVIFYLIWGGYRALLFTDAIQAIMMIALTGSLAWYLADRASTNDLPSLFSLISESVLITPLIPMLFLSGVILEIGAPSNWQRILTAKNDRSALFSCLGGGSLILLWGIFVAIIGNAIKSLTPQANHTTAFVDFITTALPPWMVGCIVVLLLAALVSTADSALFVGAVICQKEKNRSLRYKNGESSKKNAEGKLELNHNKNHNIGMRIGTTQFFILTLGAITLGGALILPSIIQTFGILLNVGFILGPTMFWIILQRGGRTQSLRKRMFIAASILAVIAFLVVWVVIGNFFTWWSLFIILAAVIPIILPGSQKGVSPLSSGDS